MTRIPRQVTFGVLMGEGRGETSYRVRSSRLMVVTDAI